MNIKTLRRPFHHWIFAVIVVVLVGLTITTWAADTWTTLQQQLAGTKSENKKLSEELTKLKNDDQFKKNELLSTDIKQIETTYAQAVAAYEALVDLQNMSKDTSKFTKQFADILSVLSKKDYGKANDLLGQFQTDIKKEQDKIASSFIIPANVPASNNAPGSGFSQQTVHSDAGDFLVSIIAADLGTTRVIVDTASGGTCTKDCAVLPLGDYVARNNALAGINGSYFCPADYPSCADRKNSFDTLLMNNNKVYFNSDNNVYSTVPAVVFGNGFIRFVGKSSDWGRDTSIDSMIAMQPLLVSGGTVVFGGNSDPKEGAKGSRSFVSNRGNTVYIGVVHNATVAESARVMKALGMDNALNLDDGGSTALWSGGYKVGPGRALPNVILFVRK